MQKLRKGKISGLLALLGVTVLLNVGHSQQHKKTIELTNKVINNFGYLYEDKTKEFPLCLLGVESSDRILVYDVRIPYITSATEHTTSYRKTSCDHSFYIGMAHNHSKGDSLPSTTDKRRFYRDERAKLDIIIYRINPKNDSIKFTVSRKRK